MISKGVLADDILAPVTPPLSAERPALSGTFRPVVGLAVPVGGSRRLRLHRRNDPLPLLGSDVVEGVYLAYVPQTVRRKERRQAVDGRESGCIFSRISVEPASSFDSFWRSLQC